MVGRSRGVELRPAHDALTPFHAHQAGHGVTRQRFPVMPLLVPYLPHAIDNAMGRMRRADFVTATPRPAADGARGATDRAAPASPRTSPTE
jgi:hypothetical protein